jgi:hypothetical protein
MIPLIFFSNGHRGGEVPHLNIFEKKGQTPDGLQQRDRGVERWSYIRGRG